MSGFRVDEVAGLLTHELAVNRGSEENALEAERWSTATRVGDDLFWSDDGERRLGSYLRLQDGSASITVLAAGTSPREFWNLVSGRKGPKRRRYDIRLDAGDFVELAYLLASRGLLTLKPA